MHNIISNLESIVCSKCEGTSYWCMSCNITDKIKQEIEKYDTTKEALGYIDQLIGIKPDTKSRINTIVKEKHEYIADDTQSRTVYSCFDMKGKLVIELSVNINNWVDVTDENECY